MIGRLKRWLAKTNDSPSYHDITIETAEIAEKSIFDLPYAIQLHCTRVGGWELWWDDGNSRGAKQLAGEFAENWLVIRCRGQVIVDSRACE